MKILPDKINKMLSLNNFGFIDVLSTVVIHFQLRLDFSSFAITGPSTNTDSVAKTLVGQVNIFLTASMYAEVFLRFDLLLLETTIIFKYLKKDF